MMLLVGLAACATPAPPRIVDSSCLAFKTISYAQLPKGLVDDAGNVADSDATVADVESHNARWDELCRVK